MNAEPLHEARARLDAGGRLLITRLRYIGDVVLSLPLVHALRRAFPHAELHYLADRPALAVLEEHPDLDRLWTHERGVGPGLRLAAALRRQRFDAVVDLFCNPRSALLTRASGAPVRIGERRRLRRVLYTQARRLPAGRSALQQHLDAGTLLGAKNAAERGPRLHLSPEERSRGRAHVDAARRVQPLVVVHLAATQPEKEWPLELALAFVQRLLDADIGVYLTRAPHRTLPSEAVAAREPRLRVLPELPLRELLGVLAVADAVVSVDGAIAHCSVALERPTLALFGPTDAAVWFPYAEFGAYRVLRAHANCAACAGASRAHTCMAALSVETVATELRALLDAARRQQGTASR